MKRNTCKGSIIIMLSAIFFGTYGVWSKIMAQEFGEFEQAWIRGLIVVLILLPIGIITKSLKLIRKRDIKWFAIVTLPGSLVLALYYYGFEYLTIGTATLLFFASLTISSYVIGWKFFKEKIDRIKAISLLLGIFGLIFVFSFSLSSNKILPALACIFAGICGGIEVVFTKKISTRYSTIQITLILYLICFLINFPIFLSISNLNFTFTTDIKAWIALFMYAMFGLLAFFSVVLGYKNLEPSVGGIIGLLEIPFGIIFGVIFFKDQILFPTMIGGLFIIVAAALPNIKNVIKLKTSRKKTSPNSTNN